MEQKKIRKRKYLKKRILRNIFIVLSISMLAATGISYLYFARVVREQKISDESWKQEQVAGSLSFMVEDIRNLSRSMIVDDELQSIMEDSGELTAFEQVKKKDTISKKLRFYNSLRPYIRGSFIEMENGEDYSSSVSSQEKDYLKQRMSIDELKTYKGHPNWVFSDPYLGTDAWDYGEIICYRTPILDKYSFGKKIGILYLEIALNDFMEAVETYGEEYENVCLTGNEGLILYQESPVEEPHTIESLLKMEDDWRREGVHRVDGGYLISKDIEDTGWKLYTWITDTYLRERSDFVLKFFFLSFVLSLAAILFSTGRLMEGIIRPITTLSQKMEDTHYDKLVVQDMVHTGDEIQTLYECYNDMVEEIQRGIDQRFLYERQKKDMEFDIMLSQINPHYLYNVLNTVVYLAAAGKNKDVVQLANLLIFSLQETLRIGEKNVETTVEKELELTRCYLKIQDYRYPDSFQVEIQCEEVLKNYSVPKTIIQPLVENAILHGILPSEERGTVCVCITREENMLCIRVTDDGEGISEEHLQLFEKGEAIVYGNSERKHIGISNVRDRIRYLYGEPYGMRIERLPERGTKVTLRLPLRSDTKEEKGAF